MSGSSGSVIDLNADLGESMAGWETGGEEALIAWLSSANIACGLPACDPAILRRLCRLAARHGVAIGAHVILPVEPLHKVEAALVHQIETLAGIAAESGLRLTHVKLHEALQDMTEADDGLRRAVVRAVKRVDPRLALFGLAGSRIAAEAEAAGLLFIGAGCPDRRYLADGSLMPLGRENARLTDPNAMAEQALRMIEAGEILAESGRVLRCRVETLCLQGDEPGAVAAAAVSEALTDAGIAIAAPISRARIP